MSPPIDDPSDASLRVALVGPTHPQKGGVAAHTTTLAHELQAAGHDVVLVGWSHLYPSFLYPGEQSVPSGGAPDVPPFDRTVRVLSWARPDSLVRAGRRLRDVDVVVVVHVIPPVVPLHLALLRAARPRGSRPPRTVVLAHNVLPHEPHPGDRALMRTLLRRVDAVVVHSEEQAELARELEADRVAVAELPPHLPGGPPAPRAPHDGPARLLALGLVRGYKGIDVLLRAMRDVPGVTLTVAGEMWGDAGDAVRALADEPRLRGRVEVLPGYVPSEEIAPLLARHDVLALTYRSATASQNVLLAQSHGLAVLASDVGTFGRQVRDGVEGLLVPPGDEAATAEALRRLADPAEVARLRGGVTAPDLSGPWARYVGTLEAVAAGGVPASPDHLPEPGEDGGRRPSAPAAAVAAGRHLVARATRAAGAVRERTGAGADGTVRLARRDFPHEVRPTDVLAREEQAKGARALARRLGLPRAGRPMAQWAALGALEALVAVRDDGRRSSLVVDASGPGSPFARWARAAGFAPVEAAAGAGSAGGDGAGDAGGDAVVLDVDPASLDLIARLHPDDVAVEDVPELLASASGALRDGGLLCLTLPVGGGEGAVATAADLRGVVARAGDAGFVLVGDLDGDLTAQLRHAARVSTDPDAAHALVRLTFRRR